MPTTNKPAPVATGTDPGLYNPVVGPVGPLDTAPAPVPAGPGLGTVTPDIPVVTTAQVEIATSTSSFVPNTVSTNTVVKYLSVSDESVAISSQVTNLNFVGTGVSVANNASGVNSVTVTIGGGVTYGNSNVVALLAVFGSNVLSTTGNVTGGNLITGAQVVASGVIQSGTGLSTGGYLSVDGSADLHNTTVNGALSVTGNLTVTGTTSTVNTEVVNVSESVVGNIDAGNVRTAGQVSAAGNITGNFFIGNGSALSSVTAANVVGTVANATYATSAGSATTATTAGTANAVAGANVSGTVANATYATSAGSATTANTVTDAAQANITSVGTLTSLSVSGNITGGNLLTAGLISTSGNITANNLGNISTINLTGSSSNVLYGNGTFAPAAGGGAANTGNVTFNDVNVIGTGNLNLQPNSASSEYLNIYLTGAADIHVAYGGGSGNVILGTDEEANVAVLLNGNVAIQAGNVGGTKTWNFDTAGNLTLPLNSVVYETNIPDGALSGSAIALKPTGGTTANQQLLIYPTANDGDHIHMTSGNLYTTELFLGSDNFYVKLANTGNVVINSNDGNSSNAMWTFGTDGTTTFPTGNITSGTSLQFTTTFANVKTVEYQTAGVWDLYVEDSITGSNTAASRLNVTFKDNLIDKPQVYIENTKESDGIALRWTFDENGNLTFPRDVAGNTDPYLTIVGGASPRILSEDASLAGPANLEITALNTIFTGASGSAIKIYADDGEIASDGNLQIWANAVGNTQYSWTFDTTGNLTTPSNLVIGPGPGNGSSIFQYNEGLQILGEGANSVVQLGWTANTSAPGSVTTIAMNYPGGGEGNVLIAVGNNATTVNYWLFDNTGNLRLPGNAFAVNYANGTAVSLGSGTVTNVQGDGVVSGLSLTGNVTTTGNLTLGGTLDLSSLSGNISTTGNIAGGNVLTGGGITATGNITGGNLLTNSRVVMTPVVYSALAAVSGARAFINDGNLAASGNFGAQVIGGASNVVPVWSDGANWYIG